MFLTIFAPTSYIGSDKNPNHQMEKLKTSGYAPVNGLNMYYEIYGDGDMPLVLIHGGGSTIETSFNTMIPLLSG